MGQETEVHSAAVLTLDRCNIVLMYMYVCRYGLRKYRKPLLFLSLDFKRHNRGCLGSPLIFFFSRSLPDEHLKQSLAELKHALILGHHRLVTSETIHGEQGTFLSPLTSHTWEEQRSLRATVSSASVTQQTVI